MYTLQFYTNPATEFDVLDERIHVHMEHAELFSYVYIGEERRSASLWLGRQVLAVDVHLHSTWCVYVCVHFCSLAARLATATE